MKRALKYLPVAAALVVAAALGCSDDSTVAPDPAPPGEDRAAPARVTDPALAYPELGGDVVLTWTAPADDDGVTPVSGYDVRLSYSFPLNWDVSIVAEDPPEPTAPGEEQTYRFGEPLRGRELYAAVRSYDAAGNVSPVSSVAHVRVLGYQLAGRCVDAISREEVEGLDVRLTSRHVYDLFTGADGSFGQQDLAGGVSSVTISPTGATTAYHRIQSIFDLNDDVSVVYNMIEYQPTDLGLHENMMQLFFDLAELYGQGRILKKWHRWPIRVYIPDFVNTFGIDYTASASQAAVRWNEKSGVELFTFVDAPPDTGVVFYFKPREQMGIHLGLTVHNQGDDGHPMLDEVNVLSEFSDEAWLYRVMMHELGHTIRFGHVTSGYIMYGGQPLPNDITDDEARAARLFYSLPNKLDMSVYDIGSPVHE